VHFFLIQYLVLRGVTHVAALHFDVRLLPSHLVQLLVVKFVLTVLNNLENE